MQIVIDISDEEYEDVKKAGGCYYDFGKAIFYGTPLPKGHGRLIDAEYLKQDMIRYGWHHIDCTVSEYVEDMLPTIIEADDAESEE